MRTITTNEEETLDSNTTITTTNNNNNTTNNTTNNNNVTTTTTTTTSTITTSSGSNWWEQISTLIRYKHYIIRIRTPISTLIELLSPLLLIYVCLVLSFRLTDITSLPSKQYNEISYTLNGSMAVSTLLQQVITELQQQQQQSIQEVSSPSSSSQEQRRRLDDIINNDDNNKDDISSSSSSSSLLLEWPKTMYNHKEDYLWEWLSPFRSTSSSSSGTTTTTTAKPNNDIVWNDMKRKLHLEQQSENSIDTDTNTNTNTTNNDINDDTITLLNNVRESFLENILEQPLPILTLSEYVGLSTTISSLLPLDDLPTIYTDSSYGQQWGNLLTLGTIHITPSNLNITNDFIQYLQDLYPLLFGRTTTTIISNNNNNNDDDENTNFVDTTTNTTTNTGNNSNNTQEEPMFPLIKIRLHDDERSALEYIDQTHANERTWALIDFSSSFRNNNDKKKKNKNKNNSDEILSINHHNWKYKIRMNFTTIPNTNLITNFVSIGLDTHYQQYYLSGYLTLQHTINEFIFQQQQQQQQQQQTNSNTNNDTTNTNTNTCSDLLTNGGNNNNEFPIWNIPMPTSSYEQNTFFLVVGFLLGFTIVMAYLYPISRCIKIIVEEKEYQLRETLYIMGVKPIYYYISYIIFEIFIFTFISISCTIVLKYSIFQYTSILFLFLWIYLFSISILCFTLMLSTLFNKSKIASIIGPSSIFVTLLPKYIFFGTNRYEATIGKKLISCILPTTTFAFGADIIADYEYGQLGITSSTYQQGDYSFQTCLICLLWNCIFYLFLTWYFEQIIPRQYGTPSYPWYFLFVPSTYIQWFGCDKSTTTTNNNNNDDDDEEQQQQDINNNNADDMNSSNNNNLMEDVTTIDSTLRPGIVIHNLTKSYYRSQKAIDNLNLTLYENQITTLLGHNGAGKTTTISILTGLVQSTSGDCSILLHDDNNTTTNTTKKISITKNPYKARQSSQIGYCPQQNTLFDQLTVLEHLQLYYKIKKQQKQQQQTNNTNELAAASNDKDDVVLKEHAIEFGLSSDLFHTISSKLSGGNKRKLCIAIALLGNPKFVLLDEPTSGMDPNARRHIWDVLRNKINHNKKQQKQGLVVENIENSNTTTMTTRGSGSSDMTILLTTHFMDEAELLSDRIAVLHSGKLQCSGSPFFLKNKFGLGYNFTIVLEKPISQEEEQQQGIIEQQGIVFENTTATTINSSNDRGNNCNENAAAATTAVADATATATTNTITSLVSIEDAANKLLHFFQKYIPNASLVRISGKEATFCFPKGAEDCFPTCFDALEIKQQRQKDHHQEQCTDDDDDDDQFIHPYSIGAFGIENASLEEVFIRLAQDADVSSMVGNEELQTTSPSTNDDNNLTGNEINDDVAVLVEDENGQDSKRTNKYDHQQSTTSSSSKNLDNKKSYQPQSEAEMDDSAHRNTDGEAAVTSSSSSSDGFDSSNSRTTDNDEDEDNIDNIDNTDNGDRNTLFTHVSTIQQIGLLYKKRFIIQKRDVKGIVCSVVLPVILVGLVLLLLMITPPVAGPPITLSPKLYKSGGKTSEVLVGGGVALLQNNNTNNINNNTDNTTAGIEDVVAVDGSNNQNLDDYDENYDTVKRIMNSTFTNFSSMTHETFKNLEFTLLNDALSSDDVSSYLLETIYTRPQNDNARYGAYALMDQIPIRINVDWDTIWDTVNQSLLWDDTEGSNVITRMEPLDLVDVLRNYVSNNRGMNNFSDTASSTLWEKVLVDDDDGIRFHITAEDLSNLFYEWTELPRDYRVDMTELSNLTRTTLERMISSLTTINNDTHNNTVLNELEENIVLLTNETVNAIVLREILLELDEDIAFLTNETLSFFRSRNGTDFLVLATDLSDYYNENYHNETRNSTSMLSSMADTILGGIRSLINETVISSGILEDLILDIDDAIEDGIMAGASWESISKDVTTLINETFVSSSLLDELVTDINSTIAVAFDEYYSAYGASNAENTTNLTSWEDLYDLSQTVSELLVDVFPSLEPYKIESFLNTYARVVDNLQIISILLYLDDSKTTDVILQEFDGFIRDSLGLLNATEEGEAFALADRVMESIQQPTSVGNITDTASMRADASILIVAFLMSMDSLLEEWIRTTEAVNGTLSLGFDDFFTFLSKDVLGGRDIDGALDGFLVVEASSIVIDWASASVLLSNVRVSATEGFWIDYPDEQFSLNSSLVEDLLNELLPRGNTTIQTEIEATTVFHNASSPHAVAAFDQAYTEYLYKVCTGNNDARIESVNHPLPLTTSQTIEIKTVLSILASLFILIPYCYIPGAFIVFIVKERTCKSKHLQLVSGVSMTSYWISTYLFDLTMFFLLTVLVMLMFLVYGQDSAEVFVGSLESFFCTTILTFGYGLSVLPFSYLLVRQFNNHSSAQIAVIGATFVTGFIAVNARYILSSLETTEDLAESLTPVFRLFPAFNVGDGLITMSSAFWEREILGAEKYPLDWDVAGKPIVLLYGLAPPYFILLLLLEYAQDGGAGGIFGLIVRSMRDSWERLLLRWNGVRRQNGMFLLDDGLEDDRKKQDEDVQQEENFVYRNRETLVRTAPVLFDDLWKVYLPSVGLFGVLMAKMRRLFGFLCCFLCQFWPWRRSSSNEKKEAPKIFLPKRAVRGVTTLVQKGETYALLGSNGAGKTTTLSALTGDVSATSGRIFVAGHCVTGDEQNGVTKARRHIGFCPQVDPLLDLMTPRETLRMFGQLRGIPMEHLESHVSRLLDRLTLTPHADKTSECLSGGNKRKLSLGIALIGDPTVLLIDESSSGLDPVAKRHMWGLISEVSKNRSVIITTHSMEEAEALCTRAGIMANGKLLCLGSVQHLKTKYLDGYTIDVFCKSGSSDREVDAVVNQMLETALPGSRLSERHGRFLRLDIPSLSSLGLGTTFRNLEEMKKDESAWGVENYSISQCSLEQVFIKLVNPKETATTSLGPTGDEGFVANEDFTA